jgi:large subunit ribosomal protein L13
VFPGADAEDRSVTKTFLAKPGEVQAIWQHFDADGLILGRLAARIATLLQGKHHGRYTPHVDTGDFVLVTNAKKVVLTGDKAKKRMHRWHTGYIGGLKEVSAGEMREKDSRRLVELAVRRMMPKTRLGRAMLKKLKIYAGAEHPHEAQQPVPADTTPYRVRNA